MRQMTIRHRGRGAQIWIYLGKMLRMFIYQNDWKVLPMAAIIAGLVGMVIRKRLFITMEGTLMGSFALVMVCIWNGCFNSIQVICRERDVIKREHRSGMHISSYIVSHMLYQALLCLLQTGVTLNVLLLVGVALAGPGVFTGWLIVDFGISLFMITYASDMMSLWVSCLARSTTTAMTIMPFVLIFQLVFSGGMMNLPAWTSSVTPLTISNPALKVLCAQSDYNAQPIKTIWNTVNNIKDTELNVTITFGQVLDVLGNEDIETVSQLRDISVSQLLDDKLPFGIDTKTLHMDLTLGDLLDAAATLPDVKTHRGDSTTLHATVGELIHLMGEERVEDLLQNKISAASQVAEYENSRENIQGYWMRLLMFVLVFAALAIITLEFIDKDKR